MPVAVYGLAVALLLVACGGSAAERPILLLSGKDDHGLVAESEVEILDRPDGRAVGMVPDGTLVYVLGEDREWLEVETLEGRRVVGWVNDFYLRGQVHVVGDPPACPVPLRGEPGGQAFAELAASQQVVLVDHHGDWVGVRPIGAGRLGVVPRAFVSELAGPSGEPGVPCAEVEVDPDARPHRH